ncbi:6-bladed beta-propeller [Neobacillus muris]|uniref:6-bladed beta-propeller n=1 Tax=Neobacillus muris TaxID=2941334 RepID=UPI00203DC737|nr:6-bladed beta-propeller [Neobacillus muris]
MKKKTVYIWMGTIAALTIVLFTVIYFFHLQNDAVKVASNIKGGKPNLSNYIQGDMDNPLNKPMDATKIGQWVYVTDTNHQQVQVFDISGAFIFKFGKKGTGEGEFLFPYGITGDKKGNIYVADLYNNRISIFDSKGKFVKYFTNDENKADFLQSPAGLRIFNNHLWVTDIKLGKVFEYSLTGKKLLEVSTAANKDDLLNAPNAVALDDEKNIYVSDSGNQRIVVFKKNGEYVRVINGSKNNKGDTKFVNPRGVGVEPDGTLLMVDNMTHYVYGFNQKGEQVFQIGGIGSDKGQFYLPNGLFVDNNGEVFVTDTVNQRIAVYN